MQLAGHMLAGLVCLWLALRLRRPATGMPRRTGPWAQMKRSLRWGFVLVTVPALAYFGAVRFADGLGIPPIALVAPTALLVAVALLGSRVEITGNVLVDSIMLSCGLTALVFTVINGVPALIALMNWERLYNWTLACVIAAVPVRVVIWIREDTHEPQ